MLGFNVFAADTDDEARFLATSLQQAFVNLRSGRPSRLPPPVRDFEGVLSGRGAAVLAQVLECSAIGGTGDGAPRHARVRRAAPAPTSS